MRRRLLIDQRGPLRRCAMLSDGILTDLALDHTERLGWLGAIVLGRVTRVVAGLDAAFVEFGDSIPGFLSAADIRPSRRDARIGQLLRTGQIVIAQVKADAHDGKGAVLTMDLSLPGRFLVHTPLGGGIHISKRLGKGPEVQALRQRLSATLPNQGGWIVRAEALLADPALVLGEAEALVADAYQVQRASGGTTPTTLLPAPDAIRRALVELPRDGLMEIAVEGPEMLAAVKATAMALAPDLLPLIAPHKGARPLFDQGDVDSAIAALTDRRVDLGQGGSLVIDRTEALTVIDVNGGERGNPLTTNLDACMEIARQLRLRNVGGIVVVDFVNMSRAGDREAVIQRLSSAVADDPVATHVYGMSRLGLAEVTRARRGPPVTNLLL
ncbi:ribonuclease E [Niveispirillum lacus]|uniref:Ribonuclease E n=1 Tax=Niveispirillum lacus TaxID=1981099 RepID=A0A255YZ71_9PROT|nr:ribonuclease E/G [Niveispirillum lacus]OYQ33720.1 ribonuclease E [Niveispirillum lacus]